MAYAFKSIYLNTEKIFETFLNEGVWFSTFISVFIRYPSLHFHFFWFFFFPGVKKEKIIEGVDLMLRLSWLEEFIWKKKQKPKNNTNKLEILRAEKQIFSWNFQKQQF